MGGGIESTITNEIDAVKSYNIALNLSHKGALEYTLDNIRVRAKKGEVIIRAHKMNDVGILIEPDKLSILKGNSYSKMNMPPFLTPYEAEQLVINGEARFKCHGEDAEFWLICDGHRYGKMEELPKGFKDVPVPTYIFNNIEKKLKE